MSLKVPLPQRSCSVTRIKEIVSPVDSKLGLAHIHFGLVSVESGRKRAFDFGPMETVVVVLGGVADIGWEAPEAHERRERVGGRRDVFDGPAWAMYVAPFTTFSITGVSPVVEVALVRADPIELSGAGSGAKSGAEPVAGAGCDAPVCGVHIVSPDMVTIREAGAGAWQRQVHEITANGCGPQTSKLMVGEVFNPAGNWSSYPPHKHDENAGMEEAKLEEVCHFRMKPESGFAFARVYSPSRGFDEAYVVQNEDTLAIPFGYHSMAAAPGYALYYLWALAGDRRQRLATYDRQHAWLKND
ncbi:MAG: 5-deoxy-glucuronate isomerase [Clostridia bacterium]|nr:5-deoxy-glucuronate isomerase [Clostridia bacterium]